MKSRRDWGQLDMSFNGEIIIYQAEDGATKIDVTIENELKKESSVQFLHIAHCKFR